jgi:hypothetical protein
MQFTDFAEKTVAEFTAIQDKFKQKYQIDAYEEWFFDQATELLTLSLKDEVINFKYVPIGSFSNNSGTWMWAWENENSIEPSKLDTLKVKEFGKYENYDKLIKGHFDSDIFEPWEFLAISQKLLGGIGGYKVNSEHLTIYFLIKEQVDNEIAEKMKEETKKTRETIKCGKHGPNKRMAFVCKHLMNKQVKVGFEEAFPSTKGMELEEDDDFQAWCDACEVVRVAADGWNEESFNVDDIRLVCEECYFDIKAFNTK